jgi:hypothetical protein
VSREVSEVDDNLPNAGRSGFSGLQVTLIVVVAMVVTLLAGWWLVTTYIFPTAIEPVELSREEIIDLDLKLERLGIQRRAVDGSSVEFDALPQPYTETGVAREVTFSERELNGLIAKDKEFGSRVALDLAPDLVSLNALIPVPDDFPVMPGKMVRVRAGAEMTFNGDRPMLILKGVSVMGVPVPNAWLGNLKGEDLFTKFGDEAGFWKAFGDGIEHIEVREGQLFIRLKE